MSENITHTIICDDSLRLCVASPEICAAFKAAATNHAEFARLGGITRFGDKHSFYLLDEFRELWKAGKTDAMTEAKLAFVLGWLSHRAADRQMKPVFREIEPGRPVSPANTSIYHDAYIFWRRYSKSANNPYGPGVFAPEGLAAHEAAPALETDQLESFFRSLTQRTLIALHTFIPDNDDIHTFLEKLFSVLQTYRDDMLERYCKAITDPDPEWKRKALEESNFYDPDEAIIATAEALQRGDAVTAEQVIEAAKAPAESHYGQALRMAYGYLQKASEFFESDMPIDTLKESLNIGKLGRDGKWV